MPMRAKFSKLGIIVRGMADLATTGEALRETPFAHRAEGRPMPDIAIEPDPVASEHTALLSTLHGLFNCV